MADNYLSAARHVLQARARPMTAQEILRDARLHDLLPAHLSGHTMQKTLQARIAEDIYSNRKRSVFYRTNVGTYFLRELANDPTLPARKLIEFNSGSRSRRVPPFRLLCAQIPNNITASATLPYRYPLTSNNTVYRHLLDDLDEYYVVITMTIILWRSYVLIHRDGRYSYFFRDDDTVSAGFRRYIDEFDVDLFVDDPTGADMSAQREYTRMVGGQAASAIIEPHFVATHLDPVSKTIVHGAAVRIGGNSEYAGQFKRRLDASALHWAPVSVARTYRLDPVSSALLALAERV